MSMFTGILQIVRFREAGFGAITATRQAFLNSLAPLLAFPLVGVIGGLAEGPLRLVLTSFLTALIALLAPLVLTHAFAERWGRENAWLRFAIAFNWSQCVIALAVVVVITMMAATGGLSPGLVKLILLCVVVYGLTLQWFLARHGLGLSGGRAALLVLITNLATGSLVVGLSALSDNLR